MITVRSLDEFNKARSSVKEGAVVGLVPTMGALHQGHISLVKKALEECDFVIVSIFVNPTQFNNPEDLRTYPRTLEADCRLLEEAGAHMVFAPSVSDIYPEEDTRVFDLEGLDLCGEGPRRPGHFNGVVQVVTRLFDIAKPDKAFFGEKDFQQLAILRRMTEKLGYRIKIVPCSIFRGEDGLALSSRNMLLSESQRAAAPHIYRTMKRCAEKLAESNYSISVKDFEKMVRDGINSNLELECEYMEVVDADNLRSISSWKDAENIRLWGAVYAGKVRLIDNIQI